MATSKGDSEHLEYHLTAKGLDFKPVIIALTQWGDKWAAPDGRPIAYEHEGCKGRIEQRLFCRSCEKPVRVENIIARKTKAMAVYQERISKRRGDKQK